MRVLVTAAPLAAGVVLLVFVIVVYAQRWEITWKWERKPIHPRPRWRRKPREGYVEAEDKEGFRGPHPPTRPDD